MLLEAGDRVEHFVIVAPLGAGGMGQVYLARDTELERQVALKVVQVTPEGEPDTSTQGAARLIREARAAAGLEHPNVVTIYEVGSVTEADGSKHPYIAMELVKGKPLRAFIGDATPLRTRVSWLVDVARALAAAHKNQLVHRDIKPENVMIRDDGVVKVLDFGLAKRAGARVSVTSSTEGQIVPSLTAKGVAVGTPYYMAPEQMRRQPLDGRADQFSWGVMAYELLSGVSPWGTDVDALELVSKLLTEHPPALAKIAPEVPAIVAAVVTRALAKDRNERYASMEDVVTALSGQTDAFAATVPFDSAGVEARLSSRPKQEAAPPVMQGRRGLAISVFALAAGALVLVTAGFAVSRKSASGPAPSSPAPAAPRECTAHRECVTKNGGKPFVCNPRGVCAAVESVDCKARYEPSDLQRDDTVWIGAMFPTTGEQAATFGQLETNAVELGRRDFAETLKSYNPPPGSAPVRPIAVVACDDSVDATRAAHHLVDDVGVPAVIGFRGTDETIDLATSIFLPHDVVTFASVSISPLLKNIPNGEGRPRMVWRTTYNTASTAKAISALVARLEDQLRKRGVVSGSAPMRVAFARAKNRSAAAEELMASLRFNGKSALENDQLYAEFTFDAAGEASQYPSVASRIAAFRPHVLVFTALAELLEQVESAWPKGAPRPYYLSETAIDPALARYAADAPERRQRLFGITSTSTTTPNARFVLHYNETFESPVRRTLAPNSSYDAFYVAAYAMLAAGGGSVDGPTIARSVSRLLPPGRPIDVGTSGILEATGVLQRDGGIDLGGATGKLDFDPSTGDAPVDFVILCADPDARAFGGVESGLLYDATTRSLVGRGECR